MKTSAFLLAGMSEFNARAKVLELRIHAHRLGARELLEEGTGSGREVAARLIRGADLLESDLMAIRELQSKLVEWAARGQAC